MTDEPSRLSNVHTLPTHPTRTIIYRDIEIVFTHRPDLNDWQYHFIRQIPFTYTEHFPRLERAITEAKARVDRVLNSGPRGRK